MKKQVIKRQPIAVSHKDLKELKINWRAYKEIVREFNLASSHFVGSDFEIDLSVIFKDGLVNEIIEVIIAMGHEDLIHPMYSYASAQTNSNEGPEFTRVLSLQVKCLITSGAEYYSRGSR